MSGKEETDSSNNSSSDESVLNGNNSDSEYETAPRKINSKSKLDKMKSQSKFFNPRFVGDFTDNDLRSPEKMKKMWGLAYKQIIELRKKMRTVQQKNRRLENQVVRLKNLVKHLKSVHR